MNILLAFSERTRVSCVSESEKPCFTALGSPCLVTTLHQSMRLMCVLRAQVRQLPPGTTHGWTFWTGITQPAQRRFVKICQRCPTLRGLAIVHQAVRGAPLDVTLTKSWGFTRAPLASSESVTTIGGRGFTLHIYKVQPIGGPSEADKYLDMLAQELRLPDGALSRRSFLLFGMPSTRVRTLPCRLERRSRVN